MRCEDCGHKPSERKHGRNSCRCRCHDLADASQELFGAARAAIAELEYFADLHKQGCDCPTCNVIRALGGIVASVVGGMVKCTKRF